MWKIEFPSFGQSAYHSRTTFIPLPSDENSIMNLFLGLSLNEPGIFT